MSGNKYYVIEWNKKSDDEYDRKVTECNNASEALETAKSSKADQHCVSTENPLENKP